MASFRCSKIVNYKQAHATVGPTPRFGRGLPPPPHSLLAGGGGAGVLHPRTCGVGSPVAHALTQES